MFKCHEIRWFKNCTSYSDNFHVTLFSRLFSTIYRFSRSRGGCLGWGRLRLTKPYADLTQYWDYKPVSWACLTSYANYFEKTRNQSSENIANKSNCQWTFNLDSCNNKLNFYSKHALSYLKFIFPLNIYITRVKWGWWERNIIKWFWERKV